MGLVSSACNAAGRDGQREVRQPVGFLVDAPLTPPLVGAASQPGQPWPRGRGRSGRGCPSGWSAPPSLVASCSPALRSTALKDLCIAADRSPK